MISRKITFKEKEVKIWNLSVKGYNTKKKVNYNSIGRELDTILQQNFLEKTIALRCMSSKDHHKTVKEIVEIIRKTGTDRYDPKKKMMFHDFYAKHNPDLFASIILVSKKTFMGKHIQEFYAKTKGDRKYGIRADIFTLYNPEELKMIHHVYDGQEESDCFKFKFPKYKQKALLGIIAIDS